MVILDEIREGSVVIVRGGFGRQHTLGLFGPGAEGYNLLTINGEPLAHRGL